MSDTETTPKRRPLYYNHVAMSVPPARLTPEGRKEIIEFYNDVFGFNEFEMMAIDGERMVINCGTIQQFIYLHGEEAPMTCPRLDHFGFSVETLEQFDEIYDKVKAWAERDERVDLIEKKTENLHDAVEMTSFYVGFLLPMMVELQHWKFIRK